MWKDNPKFYQICNRSPEIKISNSIINDLKFKNKVGPGDYNPKIIEVFFNIFILYID